MNAVTIDTDEEQEEARRSEINRKRAQIRGLYEACIKALGYARTYQNEFMIPNATTRDSRVRGIVRQIDLYRAQIATLREQIESLKNDLEYSNAEAA